MKHYAPGLRAGKTYTLSATTTANAQYIYLRGSRSIWRFGTAKTLTQSELDDVIYFYASETNVGFTATISSFQIEEGSAASAYEPCQGQSVTVSLVDGNSDPLTAYGGILDVTTGTLTVNRAKVTLDGSEQWQASNAANGAKKWALYNALPGVLRTTSTTDSPHIICSHYPPLPAEDTYAKIMGISQFVASDGISIYDPRYSAETSPTPFQTWLSANNITVVYELATPVTYTLTPAQLAALAGYNSVSANAGTLNITYKADTSHVWGLIT